LNTAREHSEALVDGLFKKLQKSNKDPKRREMVCQRDRLPGGEAIDLSFLADGVYMVAVTVVRAGSFTMQALRCANVPVRGAWFAELQANRNKLV